MRHASRQISEIPTVLFGLAQILQLRFVHVSFFWLKCSEKPCQGHHHKPVCGDTQDLVGARSPLPLLESASCFRQAEMTQGERSKKLSFYAELWSLFATRPAY